MMVFRGLEKKFSGSLVSTLLVGILLTSCNGTEGENAVEVLTKGATNPVSFNVIGGLDKGEFLVGSSAVNFELEIINNTTSSLTDLSLVVNSLSTAAMKFTPDLDGKSLSPGFGGTCLSTLGAGEKCRYRVEYKPTFSGNLTQDFLFSYKNLIRAEQESATISLLAGEAASLIFEGERINYDLGVLERTEPEPLATSLKVTNVGGLTARNMIFGKLDSHASEPFKVTQNNCPASLAIGESCELVVMFSPQNFSAAAPDGDNDIVYTSNIRYDYVREPAGGTGALTAYFALNATKIRGQMDATGLSSILFDEQTVGNKQSKLIKIINNGFKESIIHHVDVYDASNNLYARCSKFSGSNQLVCQDPGNIGPAGTNLTLEQLPIKITDTLGCLIDYTDTSYSRNPDGSLTVSGLTEVGGRTVALPGSSCLFGITFQPSVAYLSAGNINGYQLKFVYDSTWKNTVDILEDSYGSGSYFTISEAEWVSAALLAVETLDYAGLEYSDIDANLTDQVFTYDLGRIALVSDPTYNESLRLFFKNNGGTVAEIVSVKDANSSQYTFSNTVSDINSYYKNAFAVNCTFLNENGGECNIGMDLVPLASSNPDGTLAEEEENSSMYDIRNGYPEQYKKFLVEYKDGSSFEDDGVTPRPNKVLEVFVRSLLVRKGFLVFEDSSVQQGLNTPFFVGDTEFYFIKLKNAGTGGIPYITTINGFTFERPTTGNSVNYYEFVDRPGTAGEEGADKDCYDFLIVREASPPAVPPNTNATSVLNAGETCSLAVKIRIRSVDVTELSQYDLNDAAPQEWERPFWSDLQGTSDLWEFMDIASNNSERPVRFSYYDGDGIADPGNGHNPALDGYGNYYPISGGNNGLYYLGVFDRSIAAIIPRNPYPALNSVVCRDELTLPTTIPDPVTEWGLPVAGATISERCINFYGEDFDEETSKSPLTRDKIVAEENGYDYTFYAGTWRTGGTYNFGFGLQRVNGPGGQLEVISENYTGDSSIISLDTPIGANIGSQTAMDFTFSPVSDGSFETTFTIVYKNGAHELIDEANLTYQDRESTFRIKIKADAVSNVGVPSLEVQDYAVTYDPDTTLVDESALDGAPYNFPLYLYSTDPTSKLIMRAIRGGEVFAKKSLKFTNTGTSPLIDFNFNVRDGVSSPIYANRLPGRGFSIESNTCNGVNLNPTESCEAFILFNASLFEPAVTEVELDVSYQMTSETYQQENTIIRFEARDPAILDVLGISDENIEDPSGNIIPDSYPINLGFYGNGHPVVSNYPSQRYSRLNVRIENTSTEKASFLAQWELLNGATPLPPGVRVTIYNSGGIEVEATRGCFYGDDEGVAIDEDTKGFNSASGNQCLMNFYYDIDDTYFNEEIDTAFSNLKLYFYNNERASSDYIPFHFKGFVEANKSTQTDSELIDVVSTDSGDVSFSWEDATPLDSAWGSVVGYRVFYSQSRSPLDNIYSPSLRYVDTVDPEVTLSGLASSSYYYFKVAALRVSSQSGKTFVSDMGMPRKTLIVPSPGYFYDYELRTMVSMNMSVANGGFGTKSEAEAACSSERILMARNGSTASLPLRLIDSAIYDVIDSDNTLSSYPYKAIPHWMADSPVDVSGIFTPFDCTLQIGSDGDISFYQKECADCSCNNLSLFIGGDGSDLPYGANVYAGEDAFDAGIRCYLQQ